MTVDDTASDPVHQRIDQLVHANEVVLFMKGNRQTPQCGFSATVVQILDTLIPDYATADVLQDPDLREGIKSYSSWPTIPQLYVKGEFVGGCDIIQELFASGELFEQLGIPFDPDARPEITITDAAAEGLRQAMGSVAADGRVLKLAIDAHWNAQLAMAPRAARDAEVEANGISLLLDPVSAGRADGVTIEAVETERGTGFRIDNPNAPGSAADGPGASA